MDVRMPQFPENSTEHSPSSPETGAEQALASGNFTFPVDHQGNAIFVRHWASKQVDSVHNPLLIIHDVSESSSHYEDAGRFFAEAGFNTFAIDLRGHGASIGPGLAKVHFSTLLKDALQIAGWIKHGSGSRAPILICQGIGSLLGLEFQRSHFKFCAGIVMVAPTLVLHNNVPYWKRTIIRSLGEVFPNRRVPLSIMPRLHHFDESARSTAARMVTTFVAVNRSQMSLIFAKSLLNALDEAPSHAITTNCPILALIPDSSDVIDVGRTASLLNSLKGAPVETSLLQSQRHNLFTESHSNRISHYQRVESWLRNNNF